MRVGGYFYTGTEAPYHSRGFLSGTSEGVARGNSDHDAAANEMIIKYGVWNKTYFIRYTLYVIRARDLL